MSAIQNELNLGLTAWYWQQIILFLNCCKKSSQDKGNK